MKYIYANHLLCHSKDVTCQGLLEQFWPDDVSVSQPDHQDEKKRLLESITKGKRKAQTEAHFPLQAIEIISGWVSE